MGNVSSISDAEDDVGTDAMKDDDEGSDTEQDSEKELPGVLVDLGVLFMPTALRNAASKIKDDVPENVIQHHHGHLLRWLEDRHQRKEEMITLAQFSDMLMNRSVSQDDCLQAFQQFDSEGNGTADVCSMIDALKQSNGANLQGELNYVIRTLQSCRLTPGFIDVYTEDKQSIGQHGNRLLNFLWRNRAPSSSLPFPILDGFNNTYLMRQTVLQTQFKKLKAEASKGLVEDCLTGGEELRPIIKCYKSIEVSTNKSDAHRLSNGEFTSHWQSDGSARSHWIKLHIRNNVVIKQLSIGVSASDQSYMPQLVTVSVGKTTHGQLREVKEVRIPSHMTGDVIVFENAKTYYPIIQINIRRCHSDGCDCRIHGLKTLGYRIIKDPGVSVLDASAVWYLQVLASTATAYIPVAPQLRHSILQHTRTALSHMGPLSLCPTSSEKPSFLSTHVLKEMENFLTDISVDSDGAISADGLQILLSFSMARGHVAGIISALRLLQDNPGLKLRVAGLLKSVVAVRDTFWKKQGHNISLKLVGCDGGKKNETSTPENVLSGAWTSATQGYLTADGKTKVNMFFKGADHFQLTKVRIKVDKGPKGPQCGLIFVYRDKEQFDLEKHCERFMKFDDWTHTSYSLWNLWNKQRIAGMNDEELLYYPVASFWLEDEWDEVEVPLDRCPVGQYVLIKFLQPRSNTAERLGIMRIKCFGFLRDSSAVEIDQWEKIAMIPQKETKDEDSSEKEENEIVPNEKIFLRILLFLVDLVKDQDPSKLVSSVNGKATHLDMSGMTVNLIWQLYSSFPQIQDEVWLASRVLSLQLVYCIFPYISNSKPSEQSSSKASNDELFKHLCDLIDKNPSNAEANKESDVTIDPRLVKTAQKAIIDGAAIFFPDKDARRKQLFSMMSTASGIEEAPSVSLIFQSLCQFFSSVDPSALLDLPKAIDKMEDFHFEPVLNVMETLISVAYREFILVLETCEVTEQAAHLVHLLSSLQTSLLSWCHNQLTNGIKGDVRAAVEKMVIQYVTLLSNKAIEGMDKLTQHDFKEISDNLMEPLEKTFLATSFRQMVIVLTNVIPHLESTERVKILQLLMPFATNLKSLALHMPQFFYPLGSESWEVVNMKDIVLRTWDVESSHNYDNNQHITQVFGCPGAQTFHVEFDPKCETEKRYDYLEFTDSKGLKTRYDQKVGTEKWPLEVTFRGGNCLQFLFHADSSNNEWGYKFKVTAKGCPDVPLCWMFDMQLSLAKLFGKCCGATLDCSKVLPEVNPSPATDKEEENNELTLLRSDLWTTLFRGGYMVGKLQRSLSGYTETAPGDSSTAEFLHALLESVSHTDTLQPTPHTEVQTNARDFLKRCIEGHKGNIIGGAEFDTAVISVFVALLWHTQVLRDDIEKHVNDAGMAISEGIQQAYSAAESVRTSLMEQKQKLLAKQEQGEQSQHDIIADCKSKALFLLKFPGLTKVNIKTGVHNLRVSKIKKQKRNNVDRAVSNTKYDVIGCEKYPSFRLVLEFVRDRLWTIKRVQELLEERSKFAKAVADVYMFAAEHLRIMSEPHIFQVPNVIFLQEMLSYQGMFAKHYAEGLEGCGLDIESRVRSAFYALVTFLIGALRENEDDIISEPVNVQSAYDYIQTCLLHLLDINWQPHDLPFIVEIKLPELLITIAKGSVAMRDKALSDLEESDEIKEYQQYKKWLSEVKDDSFLGWYSLRPENDNDRINAKEIQMFVALYSDLLDVEINCDGCNSTLPGSRFRCLQCVDMDLCAACYTGGVKPTNDHTEEHDIVHLKHKCDECQAFIAGTRVHCNLCEDFDLCLGCHRAGLFPAGHTKEHNVTIYPLVKFKSQNKSESLLQAYVHQHVWMLFTSLSLSMSNMLYTHNTSEGDGEEISYMQAASTIHTQCIDFVSQCLRKVNKTEDEDSEKNAGLSNLELRQLEHETAFAANSQERIMGLLGAMIPPDHQCTNDDDSISYGFTTEKFLRMLFTIARREYVHEVNTQHMAMGLIGQLLQRSSINSKVCDDAVTMETDSDLLDADKPGKRTVQCLFKFGATCLERSGLEWACSVTSILQQMFNASTWRDVLLEHLRSAVQLLKERPELSSIFALFVIAGFPQVLSIGTHVKYNENGSDVKDGVVLKHFPDRHGTLIVDKRSRKRHTLNDEYIDCVTYDLNILDQQHLSSFIAVIQDIISKLKKEETTNVENLWVLSLALKALLNSFGSGDIMGCVTEEVFSSQFIQNLVYLAGQGTGFSSQWLLKDLEILSLMLYTHEKSESNDSPDTAVDEAGLPGADDDEPPSLVSSSPATPSPTPKPLTCDWEGLDDTDRLCFQAMLEHCSVSYPELRALYEIHGNANDVLRAIHECLVEGDTFSPSEEVKDLAKKWAESIKEPVKENMRDKIIDQGIQQYTLINMGKRNLEKAVEEPSEESQRLIQTADNDIAGDMLKQKRSRSADLLKKELEKHGKSASREFLSKVNLAMSILYARQVLQALLADWPKTCQAISADILGCHTVSQIPCVLDLLNNTESKTIFQKVVQNVINHSNPDSLVVMATTACQFMEEVSLAAITKESEHKYKNNFKFEETIRIPGASFLSIKFDSRCSTESGCDELTMSSSKDSTQDRHVFSGSSCRWTNLELPGDTLHYIFQTDCSNTDWGYRFTVTGGCVGRLLHTDELWSSLVYVACKQTGQHRLKTIQLLLQILETQFKSSGASKLCIDLGELKPLWLLYKKCSETSSDMGTVTSPVVRALTELFFVAENLAMDWEVTEDYLIALYDTQDLQKSIYQGVRNIASISTMISYSNKATEAFALANVSNKTLFKPEIMTLQKILCQQIKHQTQQTGAIATTSRASLEVD
ncbi:unnamed protein product [Owenia fusiformis]|uniref:Uncharacterized protein n=1 Tax=Owenia fusiformis TaxID=6347 RepID=A0A8J1XYX1_OWEFU|nr:unnamed protein product [Owenia fusiformis]